MRKQRIIAVHLLNDFSGSPMVLRQSLEALNTSFQVKLYTATPSGDGFLSNIDGVEYVHLKYAHSRSKFITLFLFLLFQCNLFFKLIMDIKKADIIYINTLLPFGAALAAFIKRAKVIYHIHEVSLKPMLLRKFLTFIAENTASKILFVSVYVYNCYAFKKPATEIIYNALPDAFLTRAAALKEFNTGTPFTILMLCSLKSYKGVNEFVSLSRLKPRYQFNLVLNASAEEVDKFCKSIKPPANCKVYSRHSDCFPFYQKAHVVLNLSHTKYWVETFGLTVLEAMACRIPVIVPTVGGVCELVDDGIQGFCIDSRNEEKILSAIEYLSSDIKTYKRFSSAAYQKSLQFNISTFKEKIAKSFDFQHAAEIQQIEIISENRKRHSSINK
jgi:glycosyltransferase involved in cell wall biosynthesis